jgi:hypothetical protein
MAKKTMRFKLFLFAIGISVQFYSGISSAYYTLSAGAYQGWQAIVQKEDIFQVTTELASLPTFGAQVQFQTTLSTRFGFRFKYEIITVKFQTPPDSLLSQETFSTQNFTVEIPYQYNLDFQTLLKIAHKQRILFNIDEYLRIDLYRSDITEIGLGITRDTLNDGGLVAGAGLTGSVLYFTSKNLANDHFTKIGFEAEFKAKLGWIYENGLGHMFRFHYYKFSMPSNSEHNTGQELKYFGELLYSY